MSSMGQFYRLRGPVFDTREEAVHDMRVVFCGEGMRVARRSDYRSEFARRFALILLLVMTAAILHAVWQDGGFNFRSTAAGKAIDAWVMAQNFVRKALLSPGTASFGGMFSERQDPQQCVMFLGKGHYRVQGWVDSHNAFGGLIRKRFEVELQDLGSPDQKWKLVEGPEFSDW